MNRTFVPKEKKSKKERKEEDRAKRANWGDINPVTKVVPDKKKYDRKREKRRSYDE